MYADIGTLSKPATAISSGTCRPEISRRSHRADGHGVVTGETAVGGSMQRQEASHSFISLFLGRVSRRVEVVRTDD